MSNTEWDASQGANPDTCLHLLAAVVHGQHIDDRLFVCWSCDSTLSDEYRAQFVWDYDNQYDLWTRRSIRYSPAARREERHPLLGVRDSRKFKVYREEFPAIFRFNGKLYEESFDIDNNEDRFVEVSPQYVESRLAAKSGD